LAQSPPTITSDVDDAVAVDDHVDGLSSTITPCEVV
jgi:hypothetical protein